MRLREKVDGKGPMILSLVALALLALGSILKSCGV